MAKTKQEGAPRVFKQRADETGRIRLDRPFTPEEASAQDEEHRRRYLEERARRFFGPRPDEIDES